MSVWQNPNREQKSTVWQNPKKNRKPFPGEGLILGLGQWASDTLQGLASHGAEPEVEMPDFLKHPRQIGQERPERQPLFNLSEYVDPEQKAQFMVGKYGPDVATLGAGLIKGAKKIGSRAVGQGIVNDVKELKNTFNKEYNSIFDMAEKKGAEKIKSKVKASDLEDVLSEVDRKSYRGIQNFIDNPTARNAHFAQSDLGKFIRKMQSKRELVSSEHNALKIARSAQEMLKNDVYRSLLKQGGLDLPFRYNDITKRYSKELVPYLENTPIRKAMLEPGQKGYLNPSRLPQKLKLEASDPLMAHLRGNIPGTQNPVNPYLMGKHPLLEYNQFLSSPLLKYGLGVGGLTYGGYELWKSLLGGR